ncbi:hypothetical protein LSUCC0246_03840 [Rhodobacterales bacterium LSUCC0246]|nr:hypothetical protein [Rhodobacterales bacterium LSUCC0374]
MAHQTALASDDWTGMWQVDSCHRQWLLAQARRQLDVFAKCLSADGSFATLDLANNPVSGSAQELHHTTRLVHAYCLGSRLKHHRAPDMIDAGMSFLWTHHRDMSYGGYVWSAGSCGPAEDVKVALWKGEIKKMPYKGNS